MLHDRKAEGSGGDGVIRIAVFEIEDRDSVAFDEILEMGAMPDAVDSFDEGAWYALVDHATVYGRDDVRFTFKNGMEIKA